MNKHALLHNIDSQWEFPLNKNEIVIRFRTSVEDELKVILVYGPKYLFQMQQFQKEMSIKYSDDLYNYYEIKLKLDDLRLAYIFKLIEGNDECYFSESGLTEDYDFLLSFYDFFQMPYINEIDVMKKVDWVDKSVFYQIFVDRFSRGIHDKDDSYINMNWDDLPTPKSFAGGDLKGIINKLDYLQELGVNTLYLTPIFESKSNHKYDIIDYKKIDPQFGDNETFRELVNDLHSRDMKIVLDAVFNHVSIDNDIFQDVIDKGKDSKYYEWFFIDGEYPNQEINNYENFAYVNYMPKINSSNIEVQDYFIDIAKYWIEEFNIDGWRLDVADEVSHDFWRRFRKEIKSIDENILILGESWHDAYPFLQGDQFDGIMNYSFTKSALDYFKGKISSKLVAERLNKILMRNIDQVNRMNLNLLDSHDTHRIFTELNKSYDKTLAAFAMEIMYYGIPCIYYGSEIFMEGGYDPDSRRGFDWKSNNLNSNPNKILKELIKLKKYKSVSSGEIKIFEKNNILNIVRSIEDEKISLLINMDSEDKIINSLGKILVINNFKNNMLMKEGFVIILEKEF